MISKAKKLVIISISFAIVVIGIVTIIIKISFLSISSSRTPRHDHSCHKYFVDIVRFIISTGIVIVVVNITITITFP
jgi:hypothetical protein